MLNYIIIAIIMIIVIIIHWKQWF